MNLDVHRHSTNSVRPRGSGDPGPRTRPKNWVPASAGTNGMKTRFKFSSSRSGAIEARPLHTNPVEAGFILNMLQPVEYRGHGFGVVIPGQEQYLVPQLDSGERIVGCALEVGDLRPQEASITHRHRNLTGDRRWLGRVPWHQANPFDQ